MKRILLPMLLLSALAACGKNDQPQTTPPAAATTSAPAVATAPTPAKANEKGVDLLTGFGVTPDFPNHIGYDIVDTDHLGKARHRVLIEVTSGSLDDARSKMDQVLIGAGYTQAKETADGDKRQQIFRKPGVPSLVLLTQPGAPEHSPKGTVGSIHVMWQIP